MKKLLLGIASLLLSFSNQFAQNVPLYNYDQVYSLDESTQIMRSLIKNRQSQQNNVARSSIISRFLY